MSGIAAPDPNNLAQVSTFSTGAATNNGLIEADRGNIGVFGATVTQMGALLSTTSVSLNGRIDLSASYNAQQPAAVLTTPLIFGAAGPVTLGAGSIIQIKPELDNTDTVIGTKLALPSAINVTGLAIDMGPNAQIYAPNAEVAISAGTWDVASQSFGGTVGQVYIDSGASIDVSGSVDVPVPVSQNIVPVQLFGAQFADSPLQRNGPLHGQTIFVDIRQSGTNADGSTWIGTPLADASGFAGLIERGVGELTIDGGSIKLTAGQSVVLQQGSILNVSGGFISYQGGTVQTSVLIGSDGRRYATASANPNISYVGVESGFTVDHPHWGITETFTSPLLGGSHFEPGYIQGGNGGSVTIQAPQDALDGELLGLTVAGPHQRQIPPSSPILSYGGADITDLVKGNEPTPSSFSFNPDGNIVIQAGVSEQTAAAFTPGIYGLDPGAVVTLPSELSSASGFGILKIQSNQGNITVASDITGQIGGSITLTANNIDVEANVVVAGGTIKLTGASTVTLGAAASLNVAGLVVDDMSRLAAVDTLPLAINGGSVSVSGFSLALLSGSVIDASGGIAISAAGKANGGNGGSVALASGIIPPADSSSNVVFGDLALGSTLKGYGVDPTGKGGTLSLQSGDIRIGGVSTDPKTLLLTPDFFDQGGFSNFVLAGVRSVTVAANTAIAPVVQSYLPISASGGARPVFKTVTSPAVVQSPVSLSLLAPGIQNVLRGSVVVAVGASITLAPTVRGAGSVSIGGSPGGGASNGNTAAIFGSIIVPGGSIGIATAGQSPGELTADLAPGSLLSTAGAVVPTVDAFDRPVGKVLAGGSIVLSGNTLGEAGATIDVSGASGVVELPPDSAVTGIRLQAASAATRIDSDGGSLTLAANDGLFMAATLHGDTGGPTALGGSLTVSATTLIVSQHQVAAGSGPANPAIPFQNGGSSSFFVDSFTQGRFDSLTLGGNVAFFGPVSINAVRSLTIATGSNLMADSAVSLTAPYVALGSPFASPPQSISLPDLSRANAPAIGPGSFSVNASDLVDIGGLTLYNIGSTSLTAGNDIRGDGTFVAVGNVTMTARTDLSGDGHSFHHRGAGLRA